MYQYRVRAFVFTMPGLKTSLTAACVAKALGANGKKLLQDDNDEDRVDDVVGFYEPG